MTNPAITTFIQEARDLLEAMEEQLLELETNVDSARIDAVFRALHTVKGSGSMFGFTFLAEFTHHFENAFDQVRDGKLVVDAALIDLSLRARDHMLQLLECGGDTADAKTLSASDTAVTIIEQLGKLVTLDEAVETAQVVPASSGKGLTRYQIVFKPAPNDMHNGMRPDLLIKEIEELGEATVVQDFSEVPPFEELDPSECHIVWHIMLETEQPQSAIQDVFIFADDARLHVTELAPDTKTPDVAEDQPKTAPSATSAPATKSANVRVSSDRLDDMMDRLGELVIAQARLDQIAADLHDPNLESVVEEIERLVTGLRDTTLSIRMLPIEAVFGKFRRVVRDLANELGKKVELVTLGGETEIDKNVIDKLSEPLVHMIRNSMDHGIESEDARVAAGKSPGGRVTLSAQQESGEILIAIEDDGGGLNTDAIRERALSRGLIAPDAETSDADLHQLIFAPGFSTAATLTSVSGRGVGMDAVRTTVDALQGSLDVISRAGIGTKVTLRLPVSLAIIDGLLVRLGDARFVIPLSGVEECVELDTLERHRESGRTMLSIRETLVPFLDLANVFAQEPSQEARRRVVIVRTEGAKLGLVVDDILGQNQAVVKSLSVFHQNVQGFAGATILGDGTTALIIDVAVLVRSAHDTFEKETTAKSLREIA